MSASRSLPLPALALLATWHAAAACAAGAPAALRDGFLVATPADVTLHANPLESLTAARVDAEFPDTTSVLVYKDDRLVFERYFGTGGMQVLNDTRSASKALTALIVGQAIADGALRSADQPVFALLPDLAPFRHDGPLKQAITLMDLLTMSSALDCDDFDARSAGNEENMYPQTRWSRWVVDLPVRADYRRGAAGRGPFAYCTGGVFLAGQVVQRATHMPLDQYFDARLFRPLGIRERQWTRSPSGEFQAGGGLRLRSRDLLKLGVLIMGHGNWRGAQLVPEAWVRRMQTISNVVDDQRGYGVLYWQRQFTSPCGTLNGWYMAGNGGTVVMTVPLRSLVAVVTRTHYDQKDMHEQTARLLQEHVFAALPCTGG
ncbi:MAG TPA: serine hydrolase [Steroidobacteraceae bacterium]|nr:serine hydrolase [Steroidobacteraceae bacterium]